MKQRYIGNERGASSLLYVLMLSLVFSVAGPLIYFSMSNEQDINISSAYDRAAATMAASAMESFIAYLFANPSPADPVAYLSAYPGINKEPHTFLLGDGTPAEVSLILSTPGDGTAVVEASAAVGSGRYVRTAAMAYRFNASVTEPQIDPDNRTAVPNEPEQLYIGEGTPEDYDGVTEITQYDFSELIDSAMTNDYTNPIQQEIDGFQSISAVCSCSSLKQIQSAAASSTSAPVVLDINGAFTLNKNQNSMLTIGSPSQPVVLLFDSVFFNGKMNLTVYGTVIVQGDFTANNNLNLIVEETGESFGDVYVLGAMLLNNGGSIDIQDTMYTSALKINNNTSIQAGSLIVTGPLDVNNSLQLVSDSDVFAGSVTVNNNAELTATAGDLFVRDDFYANNRVSVTTGGIIAVGGTMTTNNITTISTGGSTSSLIVPDTGGGTGGAGSFRWNPVRQ